MKKSLFIIGILMTIYTNILAETQWITPVGEDGNSININFKSDYSINNTGITIKVSEVNNDLVIGNLHVEEDATIGGDLDVKGTIKGNILLNENNNTCTTDNEGAIRYNQTAKNMEFCDGEKWRLFSFIENSIQTIYAEDFSDNPSFSSLSKTHAYWDSSAGNYFVNTRDNLEYKYWGYSPAFPEVDVTKAFSISLDVLFEYQDWGTYPSVHFYKNAPSSGINSGISSGIGIDNAYYDGSYKKIRITVGGNSTFTPTIDDDTWYKVKIEFDGNGKADVLVTRISDSIVIHEATELDATPNNFGYIGMGFYNPPDYGDSWSPIRVDNVLITGIKIP